MLARRKRLAHDERRQQIIQTTLACLARDGAAATSLRSVCRELGVAPSLVAHFFTGWHEVLTAAYLVLTERFLAQLASVLAGTYASERARMEAVIKQYLSTDWAGENTIGANMALWTLARGAVDLKPHFSRFMRDRTLLLHKALAALAKEEGVDIDSKKATACFILMLDGIWLELSTNPGSLREKHITRLCWFWLDALMQPAGLRRAAKGRGS